MWLTFWSKYSGYNTALIYDSYNNMKINFCCLNFQYRKDSKIAQNLLLFRAKFSLLLLVKIFMYWTFSCIIVSESFQHELCCVTLSNTKPVPATNDYDIQNKRINHNRMFGIHSNSDVAALSTPVMIILLSNKSSVWSWI